MTAGSATPRTKYHLVRALGFIGVCALCGLAIAGEAEANWVVRFVLARTGAERARLHLGCLPPGRHASRPRRALSYWDWQEPYVPAVEPAD